MKAPELSVAFAGIEERNNNLRLDVDNMHDVQKDLKEELVALRLQNAVQQQTLEDLKSRLDKWDARWWWLLTCVISALMATIGGLIVALVKR